MSVEQEQIAEGLRREASWTTYVGDDSTVTEVSWPDALGHVFPVEVVDPEPESGSPAYLSLLNEMRSLHQRKNAGYAGIGNVDPWANFRMAEGFGVDPLRGVLVRLSDKYIRVQNLLRNSANEQVGESLRDTLMDLAAYGLIAICLLEEQA